MLSLPPAASTTSGTASRPGPRPSRWSSTAATRPPSRASPVAVAPSTTRRSRRSSSAARCRIRIRGTLLQRSRLSKPKASSAVTPGRAACQTGAPAARAAQAAASCAARSSAPIGQLPSPSQGRLRKSTGSNGRQRPPQRLEAPPSRRATAISGAWWVASEKCSAAASACASGRGVRPPDFEQQHPPPGVGERQRRDDPDRPAADHADRGAEGREVLEGRRVGDHAGDLRLRVPGAARAPCAIRQRGRQASAEARSRGSCIRRRHPAVDLRAGPGGRRAVATDGCGRRTH